MIAALELIFALPAGFLMHAKGILHSDSNHPLYHRLSFHFETKKEQLILIICIANTKALFFLFVKHDIERRC